MRIRIPEATTRRWQTLASSEVDGLKDAAGCGDWCTAAILSKLAGAGLRGLRKTGSESLIDAIRFGQAAAAWNCSFEGARGGMYRYDAKAFQKHVHAILECEHVQPVDDSQGSERSKYDESVCPACHDAQPLGMRKNNAAS